MGAPRLQERILVGPTRLTLLERIGPSRVGRAMVRDLRDLVQFRFVLRNLVSTQLAVRYQRSILGFLWTLLNPLLMMTVLAIVFSNIMNRPIEKYAVYVFSGLVPWQFFSASVNNGSRSLITAEYLIRKINVQKLVFPLSEVLVALVNLCFAMVAIGLLGAVLGFFSKGVGWQLLLLPVGLVLLTMFAYGVTLITMTLVTRWRDFEHIIAVVLQASYFFTPILYEPGHVGRRLQVVLQINPLVHMLAFTQHALYFGPQEAAWPTMTNWVVAVTCAVGALVLGYGTYKVYEYDYVFFL